MPRPRVLVAPSEDCGCSVRDFWLPHHHNSRIAPPESADRTTETLGSRNRKARIAGPGGSGGQRGRRRPTSSAALADQGAELVEAAVGHPYGGGLDGHGGPGLAEQVDDRGADAAHGEQRLLVVGAPAALPDLLDVGPQPLRVDVSGGGERDEAVGAALGVVGQPVVERQQRLAHRRRVELDPRPHRHREPQRLRRLDPVDHHDLVPVEQPEVDRLTGLPGQPLEHRPHRVDAERALGGLAEQQRLGAEPVALASLVLGQVALGHQRAGDPVRGGQREPEPLRDLDDAQRRALVAEQREHRERPLDRLGAGHPRARHLLTPGLHHGSVPAHLTASLTMWKSRYRPAGPLPPLRRAAPAPRRTALTHPFPIP